ncbi:MAG: hypothetical protein LUD15_04985 [Bacteroides sp.]|nr:hypothetical protein [Bacteroides sp.]
MREDGSWGDTTESPSNMTATLLSYASLYALQAAPEKTKSTSGRSSGEQRISIL